MSCGTYNTGWDGGCGCVGTVQYAPPACNPNFPTACQALGAGTIQRVVGEDSAYCKYTVPTLQSNSILFYNSSTAILSWANGSIANPIFLGNGSGQATASSAVQIQATTPTGQLVAFKPTTLTETQFPIVTPSGSTTNWGTIENIVPNQGLVYKSGSTPPSGIYIPTGTSYVANTVYELSPNTTAISSSVGTNIVSFDNNGNPIIVPAVSLNTSSAFIDANKIRIYPSSISGTTNLSVNFGQLVVTNSANNQIAINGTGTTYNLNILGSGAGGLDAGSATSNTVYYIYVIYGTSVGVNVLMSVDGTNPSMPSSYTYYRLIGITKAVNNSVTIDSKYNQNGRIVNFGYTARQIVGGISYLVTVTGTQPTVNTYFTGTVSQYISSEYVNSATFKLAYGDYPSSTDFASVIIGSSTVGTTGTTLPAPGYPVSSEIYGTGATYAISANGSATSATAVTNYCVFQSFVPQNSITSYYNLSISSAIYYAGDTLDFSITGYTLNIF